MQRRLLPGLTALLLAVGVLALAAPAAPAAAASVKVVRVDGGPTSATDGTPVRIDADLYLPEQTPAPAVLLAHGFGGSKQSVAAQAQRLADAGYVVLAYSARGFGKTIGQISMNAPQFEIADSRALVSYLAKRAEVTRDATGDPRIAVAGGSYGGALALMLAGSDKRIDAVAADITWNDLSTALFPQRAVGVQSPGLFKQMWTSYFFANGLAPTQPGATPLCGRFSPQWCALYNEAIATGTASPGAVALMRASSPVSVTDRITAPTLLTAGLADSLFTLDQVDATARQIASAHPETPLKVVWHSGGHDGGVSERDRLEMLMLQWFDKHLRNTGEITDDFEVTLATGSVISRNADAGPDIRRADDYPGLTGQQAFAVQVAGKQQLLVAPAGGVPATITVIPGLGALAALGGRAVPGQAAAFDSAPLTGATTIVGSSTITLELSSPRPTTDVALFASLRVVSPTGAEVLPNGLVAPIRLAALGPQPTRVEVQLPAIATTVEPGDVLRVVVATTDAGFALPKQAAVYQVALAEPTLQLATTDLVALDSSIPAQWWLLIALCVALLVGALVFIRKPRRHASDVREDLRDVPLAVEDLAKQFPKGPRAVDGLSFRIPAGEVIGLLGPNGAGKTTTMRMAMGLIQPSAGEVYVYGERVTPGAPVLARIGSLVEGAGFMPHLSGRENLALYWRASGRVGEPQNLNEVLEIANLGTAIDRKVRTYSQGMRMRLGIAQAMLGMPDLLMLDEPTNGLDPQQIKAMRDVLHSFAATGRTVIVSSHMLSEVEQTCTYVVVMHRGRLITSGEVSDLLDGRSDMRLEDFFLEVVGDDLTVGKA